jgi:hypothetical protein
MKLYGNIEFFSKIKDKLSEDAQILIAFHMRKKLKRLSILKKKGKNKRNKKLIIVAPVLHNGQNDSNLKKYSSGSYKSKLISYNRPKPKILNRKDSKSSI